MDQFRLPQPPPAPDTQLPEIPNIPGLGLPQWKQVAPITVQPPAPPRMPQIAQPPAIPQANLSMPPMPTVSMPGLSNLAALTKLQNPYQGLMQREIGYGIGRQLESAMGLPLTAAQAALNDPALADQTAQAKADAQYKQKQDLSNLYVAHGLPPLPGFKPALTEQDKAQNRADYEAALRADKLANGLTLTPDEQAAQATYLADKKRADEAEAAKAGVPGAVPPKAPPSFNNSKVDTPESNYPFTPGGIKAWQSDAGREITDSQANELYQQGMAEATQKKKWDAVVAYFPTLFAPGGTANPTTPPAPPPPAVTKPTPFEQSDVREGTNRAVPLPTVVPNDPNAVAYQDTTNQTQGPNPTVITPDIQSAANQTIAGGKTVPFEPNHDAITQAVMPYLTPIMGVVSNVANIGFVKEALSAAEGLAQRTPLKGIPVIGALFNEGDVAANASGWDHIIHGKGVGKGALIASVAAAVAAQAGVPGVKQAVDALASVTTPVIGPIDDQLHRAAMQYYLQSIDAAAPEASLKGDLYVSIRRPLTPLEQRAKNALMAPFIPNADQEAANYLTAMWNAKQTQDPLWATAYDFAAWGALTAGSGALGKNLAVLKGVHESGKAPAIGPGVNEGEPGVPINSMRAGLGPRRNAPPEVPPPPTDTGLPPTRPTAPSTPPPPTESVRPPGAPSPDVAPPTTPPAPTVEAPVDENILANIETAQAVEKAIKPIQGQATVITTDGKTYRNAVATYDRNDLQNLGSLKGFPPDAPTETSIPWQNVAKVTDTTGATLWERPVESTPSPDLFGETTPEATPPAEPPPATEPPPMGEPAVPPGPPSPQDEALARVTANWNTGRPPEGGTPPPPTEPARPPGAPPSEVVPPPAPVPSPETTPPELTQRPPRTMEPVDLTQRPPRTMEPVDLTQYESTPDQRTGRTIGEPPVIEGTTPPAEPRTMTPPETTGPEPTRGQPPAETGVTTLPPLDSSSLGGDEGVDYQANLNRFADKYERENPREARDFIKRVQQEEADLKRANLFDAWSGEKMWRRLGDMSIEERAFEQRTLDRMGYNVAGWAQDQSGWWSLMARKRGKGRPGAPPTFSPERGTLTGEMSREGGPVGPTLESSPSTSVPPERGAEPPVDRGGGPPESPGPSEPSGGVPAVPPEGPRPGGGGTDQAPPSVGERSLPGADNPPPLAEVPPRPVPRGEAGGEPVPPREVGGPGRNPSGGPDAQGGDRTLDGLVGSDAGNAPDPGRVEPETLPEPKAEPRVTPRATAKDVRDVNLNALSDELSRRGPAQRIDDNLNALDLVLKLRDEGRLATPEEQAILARFAGWGDSAYEYLFDTRAVQGIDYQRRARFTTLLEKLSEDERQALLKSRRTAFYTTPDLVKTMWQALRQMGLDTLGRIRVLEPSAGSGNFLGFQPAELASKSARTAVELDRLTGEVLRNVYQRADTQITGLQDALLADNGFDVAISNVPFDQVGVVDKNPAYMGSTNAWKVQSLHTYFMVKAMDKLRPGGVQAFIVTSSALDSAKHLPVRNGLSGMADLVAAYRLPRDIFPDTSVTTDIIFLRKRMPGETSNGVAWQKTVPVDIFGGELSKATGKPDHSINEYFLNNPDHVLGTNAYERGMYREFEYQVKRNPARDPIQALQGLIKNLPNDLLRSPPDTIRPSLYPPDIVNATKEGAYVVQDGKLLVRKGSTLTPTGRGPVAEKNIRSLLGVRDAAREVLRNQLAGGSDEELRTLQQTLQTKYNAFVTANGPLNTDANASLMGIDPDGPFLRSLENWGNDEIAKFGKSTKVGWNELSALQSPFFKERVVRAGQPVLKADNALSALSVSLREAGKVDLNRLTDLTGQTEQQVIAELGERIYQNPVGSWEPSEQYLSGNVRQKLRDAESAARLNPAFERNVAALRAVIPPDVPASKIDARFGAQWLPEKYINQFIHETMGNYPGNEVSPYVSWDNNVAEWSVKAPIYAVTGEATSRFGNSNFTMQDMVRFALNGDEPTVTKTVDRVTMVDPIATKGARDKVFALRQAFRDWLWRDPARTNDLMGLYNERYNYFRETKWDGSHLDFPGMNAQKKLMPHQAAAVWRIMQDGNTLLAHDVGFGKSGVMISAGMELRRMGLSKKNVYVMPNGLVSQFEKEFRSWYPGANILTAEQGLDAAYRQTFASRIATGDWDAVLLPESFMTLIPTRPEARAANIREQIAQLSEYQKEAVKNERRIQDTNRRRTSKRMQLEIDRMTRQLQEIQAELGKRQDKTIYWEDLGVDQLFVDEADRMKNLYIPTRMEAMRGFSKAASQRADDMLLKVQHTTKRTGGRGVVFATGTPISNSIAELWTQMRYLMPNKLNELGLGKFDAWRSQFATVASRMERNVAGQYKATQRFSQFLNIPELSKLFHHVADVRTAEDSPELNLLKPRLRQGKTVVIDVPASPEQTAFNQTIGERANKVKSGSVDPRVDGMFQISHDAKIAALDIRLAVKNAPEFPDGKIPRLVKEVSRIYKEEAALKGTQVIFLDMGIPKSAADITSNIRAKARDLVKKQRAPDLETALAQVQTKVGVFTPEDAKIEADRQNIYGQIKRKLMVEGVPENEIAFIHDATDNDKRTALFEKVNNGDVRVLVGTTEKMGQGVNVQRRLAALHHVDAPWRPRDIEQREGRILRRGNDVYGPIVEQGSVGAPSKVLDPGRGVDIYQYATQDSFDEIFWQGIGAKQRSIKSVIRGNSGERAVADADPMVLTAGEVQAKVSGDPLVLDRFEAIAEAQNLELQKAAVSDEIVSARGRLASSQSQVGILTARKALADRDVALAAQAPTTFEVNAFGTPMTDPKVANELMGQRLELLANDTPINQDQGLVTPIGQFKGFDLYAITRRFVDQNVVRAKLNLLLAHPSEKLPTNTMLLDKLYKGTRYETSAWYADLTASTDISQRLENAVAGIPKESADITRRIGQAQLAADSAQTTLKERSFLGEARLNSLNNAVKTIENHLEGVKRLSDPERDVLRSQLQAIYQGKDITIEPPALEGKGLGANDEMVSADDNAPDSGDDSDIQYLSGGLGAVNPLTFVKEHPKAALATGAALAVYYGAQARQDEQKTTGHVAELTQIPLVNHVLDAGAGGVQVGDLVRGLNEYNTKDLPVMAELAARVAEIPASKLAVALGANKSNVDPTHSFFDVLQPQGFQGFNLSAPNETIAMLQKSWAKREQHNPTLAFLMSLPADPMNYLGWGEGKVAAKAFEKAGEPLLKESIITAEDYEKARNPINQASGHWWSNISRAATSKNIAQEFGRIAYRAASVTGDPVTALERIDKAVRAGTATIEQKRLAYLWGETHTIDAPAVEDLASRMGVEKPGTGSLITPELVQQIRERLRTKSKFNADDLQFLSKAFDFPTQPFGRRRLRNISRLQEWAAKYGAPDLASAIEQVDRLNPEEFRVQTTFRAREAFPTKQSPLSAWLEQYPLTMGAMATYNFAKPGVQALSHAVGLPLVLSFLMSPGWTLHAAVENTLRGYRGSLAEMPGILRGKVGTTPWYHDIDGTRRVLGHYYPSDVLLGRGGLVQAPFGDNSLTNSKFWPIGGAFNKWMAEGIRAGARAGQPSQMERLAEVRRIMAEAAAKGQAPDQQAIKIALSSKPTGAMSQALEAFANVVEHSSLAHVYGANQWAVGKFEGLMRTYWIAGEHAKVYDAVVGMLGKEAVAADAQLRDLLKMPKGVDPATWERIQAASAAVLHKPGALADVVEGEIRGTIDRLNLAKSTFLEKDIPYPVQAEWYQAMRHATPEELSALFAPGGGAEKMLNAGLEFMYGNRIRPMLDEILSNNAFDLTTVAGQREAWTALDSSLEASLTAHRDLWKWTHAVGYTMDTPEKSALFAEVRKTRQDWLALQKAEVGNARRMFENEIRKAKGISTVPNEVFDLQDQAFDKLMATYAESDRIITEYWAGVVGGAKQEKGAYNAALKRQMKEWDDYRAFRNDIENKKNAAIEDHYARNRAGSPKGNVAMVPLTGGQDVTTAQKAASSAALERVRGNLAAFTQRATVGQGQADALRQWVRDTEQKVSSLPKPVLDQIEDAHTRTARIVMDRMRSHFVDHLNTTEAGEFLRGFIPFWVYDANGGIFYLWMAQHMPGFYTDIARLEQRSGGTGYLAGGLNPVDVKGSPLESAVPAEDFGIFGNKIGPMRGLWPNRVLVFQKTLERNQPKSVQEFLQQELKAMPQQGLLGMHPSPLIEGPMALATGVMPNLPPPVTMATDVSAATGHGFGLPLVGEIRAHDPFLQANIKMELAGKGIDPDQATPEQLRIAEHNVSIRDFAQSAVPRFTYTAPEKLAEQADFVNELTRLGFSKQDQADWKARGFSPWALLDAQQKRTLMAAHPDWSYIFEAADAFKTPEEQQAARDTRTYLRAMIQITNDKMAAQVLDDAKLKKKSPEFTPKDWRTAHAKRNNIVAGRRLQAGIDFGNGKTAVQTAALNKILTPQDKAVRDYYTGYSQAIIDATDPTNSNVINWQEVNQKRKAYLSSLPPAIGQYVNEEITKNETDVEKSFYASLDLLDQYQAIPRWIGVPPAVAADRSKKEAIYARMRLVDGPGAAAYRIANPIISRRLPTNPARAQFAAQHPLLELWWIPPSVKRMSATDLNLVQFGEPVVTDWQVSPPGGSVPPPAPPQQGQPPAPALAAAGG